MTSTSNNRIKDKILQILEAHPEGLTIESLSRIARVHRQTATKYLFWLNGAGMVHRRRVGSATLHYLKKYVKNFGAGEE